MWLTIVLTITVGAYGLDFSEYKPLSDYLRWTYTTVNPTCKGPTGRNPCQDIRICKFAVASLMMSGWPTTCGSVGGIVPKVCCGLPLVLGSSLMKKMDAEKARKRECGRRTMSLGLSRTENTFFQLLNTVPDIDISRPESFIPPLDLRVQPMMSSISVRFSRQGNFPWMVAIFKDEMFICGGALIDRIHVLTAAHCIISESDKASASDYTVRIGNLYVDLGHPFKVAGVKVHEEYDPIFRYNDIALLTLESEILIPMVAHICLPDEHIATMSLTDRKEFTSLGWNGTRLNDSGKLYLNIMDEVPVMPTVECHKNCQCATNTLLSDRKGSICAAVKNMKQDIFQEDSGGILLYKDNRGNLPSYSPDIPWVLVGIFSFLCNCRDPMCTVSYTNVSYYNDWIIYSITNE